MVSERIVPILIKEILHPIFRCINSIGAILIIPGGQAVQKKPYHGDIDLWIISSRPRSVIDYFTRKKTLKWLIRTSPKGRVMEVKHRIDKRSLVITIYQGLLEKSPQKIKVSVITQICRFRLLDIHETTIRRESISDEITYHTGLNPRNNYALVSASRLNMNSPVFFFYDPHRPRHLDTVGEELRLNIRRR